MTTNNYLYDKGTILVAPGGGGALTPLLPGAANQALFANPDSELGMEWGVGSAMGNVVGPVSSTAHRLAAFADTTGELLEDSGILTANVVQGPASVTDNAIARYDSTTGKLLQASPVTMADTTGAMLFPAGGGVIMTAGGAAARKGSATLTLGTVTVNTTAAITGAVIVPVVSTVGTVAVVQAMSVTIINGVSFTVTSADLTDTSTFAWAIVG